MATRRSWLVLGASIVLCVKDIQMVGEIAARVHYKRKIRTVAQNGKTQSMYSTQKTATYGGTEHSRKPPRKCTKGYVSYSREEQK